MYLCISALSVTEYTKGNELLLVLISVMELLGLIVSSFRFLCLFVVVLASLESFFVSSCFAGFGAHCGFSSNPIILLLVLLILLPSF